MYPYIQDPKDPDAPFLHERILEVCSGAIKGGGAFAFVTKEGVDLLLRDQVFKGFVGRGAFDLVVGVDAVTNPRALTAIKETCTELTGLKARVFYHDLEGVLFHPKFCWFRHRAHGFLVTGSGNLTAKGMRSNWEAFTVTELAARAAAEMEEQWTRWVALHNSRLRTLDDPEVLARAALNVRRARPGARGVVEPEAGVEEAEGERAPVPAGPALEVLVAEIPRGSGRWKQANFSLNTFRNFFGARPGASVRIVLQHVGSAGELGAMESRPSVSVQSRNFRFELGAATGLPYPANGRPIGVFVRIVPRTFRYRLVMPDDPEYATVKAFLDSKERGRPDRMRRVVTNTDELRQAWPGSPLWREPLVVQD